MPAPKKHPDELRERAVRLVRQKLIDEPGLAVSRASRQVGEQLGINPDTLRNWVKRDRIDEGEIPGMTTTDAQRIAELEKQNRFFARRVHISLRRSSTAGCRRGPLDRRAP